MAVNLRLDPEAAEALRKRSRESGVSQQEILRRALERFLETDARPGRSYRANLIAPRRPFEVARELLELPEGVTAETLLDRDDRF
ncbi:CopG family transcriptional regulator [Agromyces sp. Marseille-P2726]|uniref:ribbon-helix-helix domain-containing protein n=1 Tax=Agromyces sp. Marseille-P2726 TaxID=2709132 RepID=UPI00156EEDF8|nr:CopG family transcriptional regulator [Agromyces sp. Marseille-P2726]